VDHVLRLAEIIRELDGNHDKGADALAEAILSHPGIADVPALSGPVVGAAAPSDQEWEARFRSWWSDHQDGAYFGAVPLVACIEWTRYAIARYGTISQPANGNSPTAGELEVMAKMFGLEVNDWAALSWLVVTCIAAYGDSNTWKSTWKSIKSAPRDGTEILASDYDSVEIVSFDLHASGMGNAWITRDGEQFYPDWYVDILEQPSLRHESFPTPIAPVEALGPGHSTAPDDGELPREEATLIPWLLESAVQAANAGHSTAAGNLTLAAQLLGEQGTAPTPVRRAPPSDEELEELANVYNDYIVPAIRRALELWGTTPTPIPVTERPPGDGDCDAEGRCWQEEEGTSCDPPAWILVHRVRITERARGRFLPFYALPLPAAPGEGA